MLSSYRLALLVSVFGLAVTPTVQSQSASSASKKPVARVQSLPTKAQRLLQLNKALFEATKNGWVDRMEELLKQGANVNARDTRGVTPIYVAIERKSLPALRLLVNRGANVNVGIEPYLLELQETDELNNIAGSTEGFTALDYATYFKQLEMVKLLLKAGGQSPGENETAQVFRIAAHRDALAIMRLLLNTDTGQSRVRNASSALMEAIYANHQEMVKLLVASGVDQTTLNEALLWTTARANPEAALSLLKAGADPNARDYNGQSSLIVLLSNSWPQLTEYYSDEQDTTKLSPEDAKRTLQITQAALSKRKHAEELFRALLAKGAKPDEVSVGGYTPLLIAIEKNELEFVKALLDAGANPNFVPKPYPSPLRFLARVVNNNNISFRKEWSEGITDPMQKALYDEQEKLLEKMLLKQDAIARLLVEKGANPTEGDNRFALGEAAVHGNSNLVKFLLEDGADPSLPFNSLPYFLTPQQRIDRGNKAKEAEAQEKRVNDQYSKSPKPQYLPIHVAASKGDTDIIRQLLAAGVDVKANDTLQNNALHYLAGSGRLSIYNVWEDEAAFRSENNGSFVQETPFKEMEVMLRSSGENDRSVVELLAGAGCPIDTVNKEGKTALEIAVTQSDVPVVQALLQAGAKPWKPNILFDAIQYGRRQSRALHSLESLQYALAECDRVDIWYEGDTDKFFQKKEKESTEQARQGRIVAFNNRAQLLKMWGQKDAAIVKMLIEYGASWKTRNKDGLTPLMLAARLGQKDVVKVIIQEGTNSERYATNFGNEYIPLQVQKYGQASIKSLPVKEKPQTGKRAEDWFAPQVIRRRENLIRQMLKREDAEIIQLLTK